MKFKSFIEPEKVVSVFNHKPIECLQQCEEFEVDPEVTQLAHYRQTCSRSISKKRCKSDFSTPKLDLTIWKFKEALIKNTTDTLVNLGLL